MKHVLLTVLMGISLLSCTSSVPSLGGRWDGTLTGISGTPQRYVLKLEDFPMGSLAGRFYTFPNGVETDTGSVRSTYASAPRESLTMNVSSGTIQLTGRFTGSGLDSTFAGNFSSDTTSGAAGDNGKFSFTRQP
jgi:hypothetical protein